MYELLCTCWDKIKERAILAHSLGGYSPSWWGKHGKWQWEPLRQVLTSELGEQETESRQEVAHPGYLSKQHRQLCIKYKVYEQ